MCTCLYNVAFHCRGSHLCVAHQPLCSLRLSLHLSTPKWDYRNYVTIGRPCFLNQSVSRGGLTACTTTDLSKTLRRTHTSSACATRLLYQWSELQYQSQSQTPPRPPKPWPQAWLSWPWQQQQRLQVQRYIQLTQQSIFTHGASSWR